MPQTVLIIDDDENDVFIARRVISKIAPGVGTKVASSGEECLALLENERVLPSVMLLDLKMRGMDGIEVLRRVRGDRRLRHIPVIVITHSTLESDEKDAYEAGADSVLRKTLDLDQFGREIKSVLEGRLRIDE